MNQTKPDQKKAIALTLQQWMAEANIKDYRQLSYACGVPEVTFYRLENGLLDSIAYGTLKKVAQGLDIQVQTLITTLGEEDNQQNSAIDIDELEKQWQQEAITILESLLLQLPTFVYAVSKNPELNASKLLPLLTPLQKLLSSWHIEIIGNVGEEITYNPQEHELLDGGSLEAEEKPLVKIRYVGYRHQEILLYRAKVSPVVS